MSKMSFTEREEKRLQHEANFEKILPLVESGKVALVNIFSQPEYGNQCDHSRMTIVVKDEACDIFNKLGIHIEPIPLEYKVEDNAKGFLFYIGPDNLSKHLGKEHGELINKMNIKAEERGSRAYLQKPIPPRGFF